MSDLQRKCLGCGRMIDPLANRCPYCGFSQGIGAPPASSKPSSGDETEEHTQRGEFQMPSKKETQRFANLSQETQQFDLGPGQKDGGPSGTVILGAPTKEAHLAWLVNITGTRRGQAFRLTKDVMAVGREATNDIVIDDKAVSKEQAKVKIEDGKFYIYDLAATNRTKVNDEEILKKELNDGDKVKIGETTLVFKQIEELKS